MIPKPNYVCKNCKIDPKIGKTDPDLKTRNSSRLVCKIDNITIMIPISVFIILSYLALKFDRHRPNYFYSSQSLHEEIVLTTVCRKAVETVIRTCQPSIVNFQELKKLICRWPYFSIDWQTVFRTASDCDLEGYIPVNIEIDYTYKISDV